MCYKDGFDKTWNGAAEEVKDIPVLKSFIRSKARYYNPDENLADQDVTSCIICMNEFGIDDPKELVELDCNYKHIFHIECLEEWLE